MARPSPSNQILSQISELQFGFLASSVISNLESDDYQIRLSTINNLITTVQTTTTNQIDVDRFLDYMLMFLDDENIIVAEKSCVVIESLCYNLYGNVALYKNHLLRIAVSNLGSKKKFLSLFGQNILHIMIKSISPQIIISEVFSMTLMSPPRTLIHLFDFIKNEVNNNTIPPLILPKYAFIFEDVLNSEDRNLVESAQYCLQAIKNKDLASYETITKRIKIAYHSTSSIQNPTSNNTNRNFGFRNQASFTNSLNSSSTNYKQPFISSKKDTYTKVNRSFASHATFASPEDDNIEISTSKPGSADDSRINIENSNDFDAPQVYNDLNDIDLRIHYNAVNKTKITKSLSSPKTRLLRIQTKM